MCSKGRLCQGELKEVAIEDLLGRKPVMPDWKLIRGWLGGRTVMVTGAGGSIGSELCRQCARHGARRIVLLEIDELALITIHGDLMRAFPDLEIDAVLGDCGDPAVTLHALGLRSARCRFPRRRVQAGPAARGPAARGGAQQRAGDRYGRAAVPGKRGGYLRVHFHRQGGGSGQCAGCHQAFSPKCSHSPWTRRAEVPAS